MSMTVERVKVRAEMEFTSTPTDSEIAAAGSEEASSVGTATSVSSFDVIDCQFSFPLNDIPRGALTLAIGRNIETLAPSAVHTLAEQMNIKRKIRVYAEIETLSGDLNFWPDGEFLIFEGYTLGTGFQKEQQAGFTISVEHWLADLNYAPATSALSSPQNPGQLTFNALIPNLKDETGKAGNFVGVTRMGEFADTDAIAEDFWGEVLQKIFLALCEEESLGESLAAQAFDIGDADLGKENEPAIKALKRIEPLPKRQCSVPLALDLENYPGDAEEIYNQIALALSVETLEQASASTLWDRLIQYASTYMFAVVPMVSRAAVVPFIPGLRYEFASIYAREIFGGRITADCPRILRAVGLYAGRSAMAGGQLVGDKDVDYEQFTIGGFYRGASTGQILFKAAPSWMNLNMSSESDKVVGAGGLVCGNALNPGEGEDQDDNSPCKKVEDIKSLMDDYAKALYVYEILKGRNGSLTGILRFDIAPGSTIKFEIPPEKFVAGQDQLGKEMYATVLQVDFHLNAEAPSAATTFQLAHVRSKDENKREGLSVEKSPIWAEPWTGCPLQDI